MNTNLSRSWEADIKSSEADGVWNKIKNGSHFQETCFAFNLMLFVLNNFL